MNIYDIVTAKEIASYWDVKSQYEAPYFGEMKFPSNKKLGLDLSWIKGASGAPVALQPSAFDAKVVPLSREGFEKLAYEMPFFKNSLVVDEKTRQELNMVIASGNQSAIDLVVGRIFDDETNLVRNARLAMEKMRMQALTTGAITISDNGVKLSYDFGVPSANKVTPDVKWDIAATADPIADIEKWLDQIENKTGARPTEALINSVTLGYIQKADAVKNAIYVLGQGKVTPNRQEVLNYLLNETGVTFYVYNKGYSDNGQFTKFVADGTVVFMPEGALGNTWFGTTPEESDLMTGTDAQVSIVETGVALTTTKLTDPVNVSTKASMICLPSFELADQIIIASVKTNG